MNKFTFTGNGRNKDFYFTFPFFTNADIVVKINNNLATGYSVFCIPGTEAKDFPFTGGRIHFATAPKSTDIVTIERKLQLNRLIDYQPTAILNPTTINQDMNYFFELLKDIKGDLAGFAETYADFTDTESAQNLLTQIDAVINEIDNLGDISTIRSNITDLGTSVSNLSNSLNSLTTTVGTHTTDIGTNTNDITALKGYDYVIESQEPTAENNYTWYRKYKSGWVEMGGRNNGLNEIATIQLPINMKDLSYTVQITRLVVTTANDQASISLQARNLSLSSFQVRQTYATSNGGGTGSGSGYAYNWIVFGFSE